MATLAEYVQPLTRDTSRGPSNSIWAEVLRSDYQEKPDWGYDFFEEFLPFPDITALATAAAYDGPCGRFHCYAHQGGTITDGQAEGGVAVLAADGDNEGVSLGSAAGGVRIVTPTTYVLGNDLYFEARVASSSITATKHNAFVGLFGAKPAAAVPITNTDDTMATTAGWVGFFKTGAAPTDWRFGWNVSGGTPQFPTPFQTLSTTAFGAATTAGQFVKLGFKFTRRPKTFSVTSALSGQTVGRRYGASLEVFIDGVKMPAVLDPALIQAATFPSDFLAPAVSVKNLTATAPGSLSVDWIGCSQKAAS